MVIYFGIQIEIRPHKPIRSNLLPSAPILNYRLKINRIAGIIKFPI